MQAKPNRGAAETYQFADDGSIPNNPVLSVVVFRRAIDLTGSADPEDVIEKAFQRQGWVGLWRAGISPHTHYHSRVHEVMAIARGRARVRFGGAHGMDIDLGVGDAVVLPAGTGHQCAFASPELVVIGAFPPNGRYDLCRGSKAEHAKAMAAIPHVPLPTTDPIRGKSGPLVKLWAAESHAAKARAADEDAA